MGRIVLGHTALYGGAVRQVRSVLAAELGLTGRGVIAIATRDRDEAARHHLLTRDPEGRVVICDGDPHHQAVIEAAVFIAYGSSRELKAGLRFIAERQLSLGSQNN